MKRWKMMVALLVVVLPLVVVAGPYTGKEGVVTSEPLPCVQVDDKLVCFDGALTGDLLCRSVDASTILCSSK